MRPAARFIKDIELLIASELAALGFVRGRGGFRRSIEGTESVRGALGLNRGLADQFGGHEILVFVGVESSRLEELYTQLVPGDFFAGANTNLSNLMPKPFDGYWSFDPDTDNAATARALADAVTAYGLPFIESLVDVEDLVTFMREHEAEKQRAWRLPPALLLVGDVAEAKKIVEAAMNELGESEEGWNGFYREFARRFFDFVDE